MYLFLFYAGVFALGAVLWWVMYLGPVVSRQSASDWVEAPCMIEVSEISIGRRQSYRPKIEFTYQVDGEQRRSDQYDFTTLNRWRSRCESIVNGNPVGSDRQCFYDPSAPEKAVIIRECDFSVFGFVFPLVFIVLAIRGFLSIK